LLKRNSLQSRDHHDNPAQTRSKQPAEAESSLGEQGATSEPEKRREQHQIPIVSDHTNLGRNPSNQQEFKEQRKKRCQKQIQLGRQDWPLALDDQWREVHLLAVDKVLFARGDYTKSLMLLWLRILLDRRIAIPQYQVSNGGTPPHSIPMKVIDK
jgi:hypothetical protein